MKVGDYVRTKYGIIAKITHIYEDHAIDCDRDVYYVDSLKDDMPMMEIPYFLKDTYIIKSSPNIIDLIELRDIVELYEESWFDNGVEYEDTGYYEVLAYTTDRKEIGVRNKNGEIDWYSAENLRGIITYEQIKVMEYKLEVKDE